MTSRGWSPGHVFCDVCDEQVVGTDAYYCCDSCGYDSECGCPEDADCDGCEYFNEEDGCDLNGKQELYDPCAEILSDDTNPQEEYDDLYGKEVMDAMNDIDRLDED